MYARAVQSVRPVESTGAGASDHNIKSFGRGEALQALLTILQRALEQRRNAQGPQV
jgi:hypothetical protein